MIKKVENPFEILEIGAKGFTNDLLKLPKPYSKIIATGYTHLVDSFAYKKTKNDVEVGWGKYYGPMVEDGTKKMNEQPHLQPTFERNKNKYYQKMLQSFYN